MLNNMSEADRKIRFIIGLAIAVLLITKEYSGGMNYPLGMIAIVLMATGYFGICPVYSIMKVSTVRNQSLDLL